MRLLRFTLPLLLILGCLTFTGCGGFQNAAPLPVASYQVSPGAIRGAVLGGHLPIAGAHVFIFEAQANGYGGQVVSRLDEGSAGTEVDYAGSNTSNPTYGDYFLTTGADGGFTIGGNYSCTAGNPVYLYAQGGSTVATTPTTTTVDSVILSAISNGYQVATVTVPVAVSLAAGSQVTFTGITGLTIGVSTSVLAATTNSTTFTVSIPSVLTGGGVGFYLGPLATVSFFQAPAAANPQIVNLAMLGLCPGSTNEFSSTIPFVVVNEVSTVAMAETMSGFATSTSGTNPITASATNAVHIGASTTNLVGLQNAALNAGQLFNITGNGPIGNFVNGGDAHLANLVTPAGNGSVPQALIDTIANILAACVDDSTNTYNPYGYNSSGAFGAGTSSTTTCTPLFETATYTGVPTTAIGAAATAIDTASAALNIAHFPAGAVAAPTPVSPFAYDTSFVSTLFPLQQLNTNVSGKVAPPFQPMLSAAPNDFSVAIQYAATFNSANGKLTAPESIAIDASGNAWLNSGDYVLEMNPLGVISYTSPAAGHTYGYVSIDPSGNVWTGNEGATSSETEFTPGASGTATITTHSGPYTGGLYDAMSTVTDGSGNVYIGAAQPAAMAQSTLVELTSSTSSIFSATPFTSGDAIAHGAVGSPSSATPAVTNLWFTTENPSGIGQFNESTGAASFSDIYTVAGLVNPEMPAIDASDAMWVANAHIGNQLGALMRVTSAGGVNTFTGGDQDNPYGTAIDGVGHIWMTNECVTNCTDGTVPTYPAPSPAPAIPASTYSSILEFDSTGAVLSPYYNFTLGNTNSVGTKAGQIQNPLNIAVDPSGVLWITSKTNGTVAQVFGPGAPTYTPLSNAAGTSNLGARP